MSRHYVKADTEYKLAPFGDSVTIPKGTRCIPANNLPEESYIKFWAKNWAGMSEAAKSHARTYGFGLTADEVETV